MATNDILAESMTHEPDFFIQNHGSIMLVTPMSQEAKDWFELHLGDEVQWFGSSLVVESRYIMNLVDGIRNDGLTVGGR